MLRAPTSPVRSQPSSLNFAAISRLSVSFSVPFMKYEAAIRARALELTHRLAVPRLLLAVRADEPALDADEEPALSRA